MVCGSVARGAFDADLLRAAIDGPAGASCPSADGFSCAVHAPLNRSCRALRASTDGRAGAFGAAFDGGSSAVRRAVQGLAGAVDGRWGRSGVLGE